MNTTPFLSEQDEAGAPRYRGPGRPAEDDALLEFADESSLSRVRAATPHYVRVERRAAAPLTSRSSSPMALAIGAMAITIVAGLYMRGAISPTPIEVIPARVLALGSVSAPFIPRQAPPDASLRFSPIARTIPPATAIATPTPVMPPGAPPSIAGTISTTPLVAPPVRETPPAAPPVTPPVREVLPPAAPAVAENRPAAAPVRSPAPSPEPTRVVADNDVGRLSAAPPARAEVSAIVREETEIRRLLDAYRDSYDRLDAVSAARLWPGVDAAGLQRAFSALASQQLEFDDCALDVLGQQATARCRGSVQYVRRVGGTSPQSRTLSWAFELDRGTGRWLITRVTAQ